MKTGIRLRLGLGGTDDRDGLEEDHDPFVEVSCRDFGQRSNIETSGLDSAIHGCTETVAYESRLHSKLAAAVRSPKSVAHVHAAHLCCARSTCCPACVTHDATSLHWRRRDGTIWDRVSSRAASRSASPATSGTATRRTSCWRRVSVCVLVAWRSPSAAGSSMCATLRFSSWREGRMPCEGHQRPGTTAGSVPSSCSTDGYLHHSATRSCG